MAPSLPDKSERAKPKFLVTMLPVRVAPALREHLARVRAAHERELAAGFGTVWLPDAYARKNPGG